jgi:hypothetical protein
MRTCAGVIPGATVMLASFSARVVATSKRVASTPASSQTK